MVVLATFFQHMAAEVQDAWSTDGTVLQIVKQHTKWIAGQVGHNE
jgi:hypothetical protein